jgi:hypothetical protein
MWLAAAARLPSDVEIECTHFKLPDCKRQLSRRHLLADSGIDQVRHAETR